MKNTVITVRLPRSTRMRIERAARREGRSLSSQVERLIEQGLTGQPDVEPPRSRKSLAGIFRGGPVPALDEFREVRADLSAALEGRRKSS